MNLANSKEYKQLEWTEIKIVYYYIIFNYVQIGI